MRRMFANQKKGARGGRHKREVLERILKETGNRLSGLNFMSALLRRDDGQVKNSLPPFGNWSGCVGERALAAAWHAAAVAWRGVLAVVRRIVS